MKIGHSARVKKNKTLACWKREDDPGPWTFSPRLESKGLFIYIEYIGINV